MLGKKLVNLNIVFNILLISPMIRMLELQRPWKDCLNKGLDIQCIANFVVGYFLFFMFEFTEIFIKFARDEIQCIKQ